jgi:predicted Zn-dependent protease
MLNKEDLNLLARVQRHLRKQAEDQLAVSEDVALNGGARHAAKKYHDRLLRDERDMNRIRRRLKAAGNLTVIPADFRLPECLVRK